MLLLSPEVVALSRHTQTKQVVIEPEALTGARNHDGSVVDPEKESIRGVPARFPLVGRKLEDLEGVTIGIPEVEGPNARRVRNRGRQELRTGRRVAHVVGTEERIGAIHVAHDDRHVLKPVVVTAAVDW